MTDEADSTNAPSGPGSPGARGALLARAVGHWPAIFFHVDAEGLFTESVGKGLARLGLRDGEVVGMDALAAFPQSAEQIRSALAGETVRYQAHGERNSEPWWFDVVLCPDGGTGAVGLAFDITDHKLSERRAEVGNERMDLIAGELPVVLFTTEPDGTFRACTGRGLERLGLAGRDLTGENVGAVFPHMEEEFGRALAGESVHFVGHGADAEGLPWWHDTFLGPDPDPLGGITGFAVDITRRVRVQQELRESRDRLRSVSEQAADAFFLHDLEGRIVEVNQRACDTLGYSRSDLLAMTIGDLGRDGGMADLVAIWAGLRPNATRTIQGFQRRRDGTTFPTEARIGVMRYGDTDLVLALVRDTTARVEAERTRLRLEDKVRRSQKLESLGILAGGIAHDFNNLLTGVLGNASHALMELEPDAPLRHTIRQIELAAMRAAELAQQMLAYSGRGRFIVRRLDLSALVDEMAESLQAVLPGRPPTYDLASGLPAVEADASQIRQVVMNLSTNAADAVAENGGTVRLGTGLCDVDRGYLADSYVDDDLPPGRYVYVEVSDEGRGMDLSTRARLFDPFFTTKSMGRGLGLAATLGIVRGHSGAIRVASEPGRGTTIRVLFPCVDAPVETPPPSVHVEWPTGRATILVVDDEETVRSVSRLILEQSGYTALAAHDGEHAVELFRVHRDQIAVVLLDLTMPRMDGERALRELRGIDPDLPVILMSGFNEQDLAERFAGRGLAGFLQKPFRARQLLDFVRRAIPTERRT